MTTAAKRARKKANSNARKQKEAAIEAALTDVFKEEAKLTGETEHAAALTALAATRDFKKKFRRSLADG